LTDQQSRRVGKREATAEALRGEDDSGGMKMKYMAALEVEIAVVKGPMTYVRGTGGRHD